MLLGVADRGWLCSNDRWRSREGWVVDSSIVICGEGGRWPGQAQRELASDQCRARPPAGAAFYSSPGAAAFVMPGERWTNFTP